MAANVGHGDAQVPGRDVADQFRDIGFSWRDGIARCSVIRRDCAVTRHDRLHDCRNIGRDWHATPKRDIPEQAGKAFEYRSESESGKQLKARWRDSEQDCQPYRDRIVMHGFTPGSMTFFDDLLQPYFGGFGIERIEFRDERYPADP